MSCGMWLDYERNSFLYMHIPDSVSVCVCVCVRLCVCVCMHVWCGMYGWVGVCLSSKQMIIHLT